MYGAMNLKEEAETLLFGDVFKQNEEARATVLNLSRISEDNDQKLLQTTEETFKNMVIYFFILGFLLVVLCIILTFFFVNIIASPLKILAAQSEKIAYGDLSIEIEVKEGRDEISVLQRSFGMMIESLRSVSSELKNSVDELNNVSSSMQDKMETGFQDTASIIKYVECNSDNIKNVSNKLNSLMNEFKL